MNYYLICDGGGTKTECMVFDSNGVVLGYSKSLGTNAIFEDNASETLESLILQTLKISNKTINDMYKIALFIPGFNECIVDLKKKLAREDIILESDENNAFYGALASSMGIVANCGTGSFVSGRDRSGKKILVGGWGPLFGDFGSAYHIGIMCLAKISLLYDMRIRETLLEKYVLEKIDVESTEELRREAYQPKFTRMKIAELSQVVSRAANEGDEFAEEIIDAAAKSIVEQIAIVRNMMNEEIVPVSVVGGVTKIGSLFIDKIKKYLKALPNRAYYVEPKMDPISGGALYLLNRFEGVTFPNSLIEENIIKYKRGN